MPCYRRSSVALFLALFAGSSVTSIEVRGELQPDHVAIVANADNLDSLAVARHYAQRRRIPSAHIIRLPLPHREHLSREEYDRLVVTPLREALRKAELASTIRVLVTTYGVPLRVEAPTLSADEKRWLSEAQSWVKVTRTGLEQVRVEFERTATGSSGPEPPADGTGQNPLEMARTAALLSRLEQAMRGAVEQLQRSSIPASPHTTQQLMQLVQRYGGWGLLLEKSTPSSGKSSQTVYWRTLLERTKTFWPELGRSPIASQRPLMYRWTERLFGLRGVLELASAEVDLLTMAYADASLDSELSLLWWDRSLYPVAWRWANPFFLESRPTGNGPPILMVSRLDGPAPEIAMKLVDKALYAEQEGLQGTVYLDARGLSHQVPADTYSHYDQSLRDAAELTRQQSDYRVTLDNSDKTFSQPGDAPDVALYIGWYRLRAYEDAFAFNPGAIGYHMASAEAVSVHDPRERGWCKNALERGITATLGSVGEPYLDAFPEPAEFMKLVLSGKYALAETYAVTSRYLSWRMVLFGDPLYNPMRGRSRMLPKSTDKFPTPPSDRPMTDSLVESRRVKRERESRIAQLVQLLQEAEAATTSAR